MGTKMVQCDVSAYRSKISVDCSNYTPKPSKVRKLLFAQAVHLSWIAIRLTKRKHLADLEIFTKDSRPVRK